MTPSEIETSLGDTSGLSIMELAEITNQTFTGYFLPISHTTQGYASFCRTHSVDLAQSVTLRNGEGRVIGLAMLAVRDERGWCGGFGIVPEYRGQGLSLPLIEALIARAKDAGLRLLQLEVLSQNEPARRTYLRGGMHIVREVFSLSGAATDILPHLVPGHTTCTSCSVLEALQHAGPGGALSKIQPTWQREPVMLLLKSDLHGWKTEGNGKTATILYAHNVQGGLLRIEHLAFDNETAAHAVLDRAIHDCQARQQATGNDRPIKLFLLNEPEATPLHALLTGLGLTTEFRQHEMQIALK